MNLELLKKPFPKDLIKWRLQSVSESNMSGMVLAYIDARDVMDRLDEVCGPGNWQVRHPREGYCEIGINVAPYRASPAKDGIDLQSYICEPQWLWRGDGADRTKVEGTKGQFSDCEKRAGVQWGIGRYLYGLPTQWVDIVKSGKSYKIKNPKELKLPDWAVPNPKTGLKVADRDAFFEASMNLLSEGDVEGFNQIWDEYGMDEKVILWSVFNSEQRTAINKFRKGE